MAHSDVEYEVRVANLYKVEAKLPGQDLFNGTNVMTGDSVTIKLEPADANHKSDGTQGHLIREARLLKELKDTDGFPRFLWYGVEGDFNVLVCEKMTGVNL